ncbi:replication terminator protein [Paenibacillus rhizophilus]|uniref:replication terminator protein n=1 Tax=Paenibacillus rhizophilus TaxID=1850366 RepID=UPI001639720B|nr:replication terminator protein [Paenibacillus rhizophilus]
MSNEINLDNLAGGAVSERLNIELKKAADNIMDPNTDWKKARKVTMTITLKPDEERDIALVSIDTKTVLAPAHGVATKLVFGKDNAGQAVVEELVSGTKNQMMMDNDGDLADDRGKKLATEEAGNNVSYLQRKAQGGK